ncbi:C40 family peptidase [Arthrobacter sp. H16F315]|uniref:C40 family peptidase n=1 Tax=Arthrobacter sp. H16F315 TaxID=2955314 RepID=UPI003158404E
MANATKRPVGRSCGHEWAVFMATSGHFCWPPVGTNYWPLATGRWRSPAPQVEPTEANIRTERRRSRTAHGNRPQTSQTHRARDLPEPALELGHHEAPRPGETHLPALTRSWTAYPELYARWEAEATAIVEALDGGMSPARCSDTRNSSTDPVVPTNLSQIRKDILRFTEEGVGGAYVWGGTAYKAWDCSGYVQWIYRQVGVNLPRVDQWRVGTRTENPQPGDLVVQNAQGPADWGHVGIYAGDGMMYSALNPAVGTLMHPVAWNTNTAYFDLLI